MSELKDFAIMPSSDYQAICDAVRSKTGSTELLKSGELASAIEGISSGGNTGIKVTGYTTISVIPITRASLQSTFNFSPQISGTTTVSNMEV